MPGSLGPARGGIQFGEEFNPKCEGAYMKRVTTIIFFVVVLTAAPGAVMAQQAVVPDSGETQQEIICKGSEEGFRIEAPEMGPGESNRAHLNTIMLYFTP